jgi:hypothetical protein
MELSSQDNLRLNVLLASKPQAIRINESTMTVHGLSDKGEAQVQLHPTGREDRYLKRVRELLSGHVLGSPGGYPVYLQRWTRMGQMRDQSLEQLLLLGEPEAIVAAVTAPGLTDELARRAWWAMEDATNARHMLRKQAVVQGEMGPLLAAYLVDHLPFETEPEQQIETVMLVLQPGLLDAAQIESLWRKSQRKPAYYVGFLAARPWDLPLEARPHPDRESLAGALQARAADGDALAGLVDRLLDSHGQAWLQTVLRVLEKPSNQDVVNSMLDVIAGYCAPSRPEGRVDRTLPDLEQDAGGWVDGDDAAALRALGVSRETLFALRVLSGLSYGVVRPVFGDSTAIGSLMRRKLEPVMTPLRRYLGDLAA